MARLPVVCAALHRGAGQRARRRLSDATKLGDIVINDLVSSHTGSYAVHRPLVTLAGPMNSVTPSSDVDLTDPQGGAAVSIQPQPGGVSPLPVTIQGFTYNGRPLTMADVVAPGCRVTLLP